MRILNPNNIKKYMDDVLDFHTHSSNQQTLLIYEGNVNDDVTIAFTKLIEQKMMLLNEQKKVYKKVYFTIIELLQNIKRHSDNPDINEEDTIPDTGGIFIIGSNKDSYYITTGNLVKTTKTGRIKKMLNEFNNLDSHNLKLKYRQLLEKNELTDKGGAGLGFIDVIKKTKNAIKYQITEETSKYSFFVQQSKISRI